MTKIFIVMERHGEGECLPVRAFSDRLAAQSFIVAMLRSCKVSSNGVSYWTEEVPITVDTKVEEKEPVPCH